MIIPPQSLKRFLSVQEVQLGLKAGFVPKDIIFTPNGVSLAEIEQAILTWIHLVSAAIWVGGSLFIGIVLSPLLKTMFCSRFSPSSISLNLKE